MKTTRNTVVLLGAAPLAALVSAGSLFTLTHPPLGEANLNLTPDGLLVDNLGSSGEDGVRVELTEAERRKAWAGLVKGRPPGDPVSYTVAASGPHAMGVVSQACSMTVEIGGPAGDVVRFDFSALGPASLHAEYFFEGQVVAVEDGLPPGEPVLGLSASGIALADMGFSAHWDNISKVWRLDGNMSTDFTIGGNPLAECDSWLISAINPSVLYDDFTGVAITATGVPDMLILSEDFWEEVPGDINLDCVIDTADLGLLVGGFGSAGADTDINGDGVTDTADLGMVLSAFGDGCEP